MENNTEKKSLVGKVVGSVKDTGKAIMPIQEIQAGSNIIGSFFKTLKPKQGRVETYNQARVRLGVSNEDIMKNHENFVFVFYISLFLGLGCIGLIIKYAFFDHTIMGVLSSSSILLVCLANAFKHSFRAYQIKIKSLCSIKEYIQGKDYFPTFLK